MPSRRDVLAVMTLGGATALAGCAGTLADGSAGRDTSEDWPQFRADAANTGANLDATGPVDDPDVEWVHLGGPWYDMLEPVVTDAVYTVDDGVAALDSASGDVDWRAGDSYTRHTPAVAGDLLVPGDPIRAVARDGGRSALGRRFDFRRWETTIDADTSLTLHDEVVLLGGVADSGTLATDVVALETATGEIRWTTTGSVEGAPATDGEAVYVATDGRDSATALLALDARDGSELWSRRLGEGGPDVPVVLGEGLVYVPRDGSLRAFDTATGDAVWTFTPDGETRVSASPALAQERLYVPTSAESSGLVALDAATGERLWAAGDGPYRCSPSVGDDGIYAVDFDGRLSLHWRDGPAQWRVQVDAPVASSPVPSDGRVFVGTRDGLLYALGEHE
ncbi:outer membrane protein assembly factor BamB family protein [Halomarina oriensis]|uniref:PQQ-binding-like beta-propeller repeat protein n=1 Tax=Halomarina oriensis TaxID=671145 RepID=A0A6B0GPB4_9EURY|nr:PQQ-binding-like beta-propeller repeat protein [Halomarina oriensis]MWG35821.1 PQQ-binding-like beta-propeller repeat protein [Halomarina oriensis]